MDICVFAPHCGLATEDYPKFIEDLNSFVGLHRPRIGSKSGIEEHTALKRCSRDRILHRFDFVVSSSWLGGGGRIAKGNAFTKLDFIVVQRKPSFAAVANKPSAVEFSTTATKCASCMKVHRHLRDLETAVVECRRACLWNKFRRTGRKATRDFNVVIDFMLKAKRSCRMALSRLAVVGEWTEVKEIWSQELSRHCQTAFL